LPFQRIGNVKVLGGYAILLGATDRRDCDASSPGAHDRGYEQVLRRIPPHPAGCNTCPRRAFFEDDPGPPLRTQAAVSDNQAVTAACRTPDAIKFYLQPMPPGIWPNEVTVRSTSAARMYEPDGWIRRVSPTPLLRWQNATLSLLHQIALWHANDTRKGATP